MPTEPPLVVDHDDVVQLQRLIDDPAAPPGHARRARIVLLSAKGLDVGSIARELGCGPRTVVMWQERFRASGRAGLVDAPRSGRPPSVDALAVVARTLQPPVGAGRWTSRRLATDLGVSNVSVAAVWRAWGIRPARDGRMALATEPALPGRFAAVVGLCLRPGIAVLALDRGTRWGATGAQVPFDDRPDLLALPDLDREAAGPPVPDDAEAAAFLQAVADRRRAAPGPRSDVALLATDLPPPLARTAVELGLAVFTAVAPWGRLARVACLAAAAQDYGRATVLALDAALRKPRSTASLTWLPPTTGRR